MSPEIPSKLYRYRSPSLAELTNLSSAKLWFSSPDKFNDPFDCSYGVELSELNREICIAFLMAASKGNLNEERLADFSTEQLMQGVEPGVKLAVSNSLKTVNGVCCFSEINNDLLMWGHYCAGHRGFCLEFDTSRSPLFEKSKRVIYSDSLPILDVNKILAQSHNQILSLLLTKSECWKYEKEWRVLNSDGDKACAFERQCLTGVYCGAKMSEAEIHTIGAILENTDTKLYQMRVSKSRFELEAFPVTFTRYDYRRNESPLASAPASGG